MHNVERRTLWGNPYSFHRNLLLLTPGSSLDASNHPRHERRHIATTRRPALNGLALAPPCNNKQTENPEDNCDEGAGYGRFFLIRIVALALPVFA